MQKNYTYSPSRIDDNGLNQIRFELGDTMVENGEDTCILCDEEYTSLLNKAEKSKKSWKAVKIESLKAIVMKLSYEVDYNVADMSLKLSTRYNHFKSMLDELEKSEQSISLMSFIGGNIKEDNPYFYLGMQENPKIMKGN